MKKTELKNCPSWLLEADTLEEDVEMGYDNKIIWKGGTWKKGVWKRGTWKDGTWEGGTWEDGIWEDGYWEDGIWEEGDWRFGTWKKGTWEDGYWEDGIWEDGIWEDGIWGDGIWEKGVWKEGYKRIGQCKWECYYNAVSGYIRIGCEENTIEDWDLFFESDEVFDTPRGTSEFFKIYQAYLIAKAAMEIETKFK